MTEIKERILYARRRIDEIDNIEIVDDLTWDTTEKKWYIKIRILGIDTNNEIIPKTTTWYITFPDTYPEGEVKVCPAADGGISDTFNHQNNNGLISKNSLWRTGSLCLSNNLDGLLHEEIEPCNYEDKLFWNAKRAVEWVKAAAQDRLISKGDYYEKPHFVTKKIQFLAYNEDRVSYMEWEDAEKTIGYVEIVRTDNLHYFANSFYSLSGELCKTTRWGKYIEKHEVERQIGAWILLDKEPVIHKWQAPNSFYELEEAMKLQGRDLIKEIRRIIHRFRDKRRHIIMIGFPVPKIVGYQNQQIHWEAFLLPILTFEDTTYNGFRNNERGRQARDFCEIIPGKRVLDWLLCDNWNLGEIVNRGHFDKKMTSKRFVIIGAGTLGASIGELLVRSGVYNISVIDDDCYTIGNSARHILEIGSVGKHKADEVCNRYNCINPNVFAVPINESLSSNNIGLIDSYDVIIDCSASNNVLSLLSSYTTRKKKTYISVSFGYKADMLFLAFQRGNSFNKSEYYSSLGDKIKESEEEYMHAQLPWDGVGCWHPVYPAMAYDVQMVASIATGAVKTYMETEEKNSQYLVYGKKYDEDGVAQGFARL